MGFGVYVLTLGPLTTIKYRAIIPQLDGMLDELYGFKVLFKIGLKSRHIKLEIGKVKNEKPHLRPSMGCVSVLLYLSLEALL